VPRPPDGEAGDWAVPDVREILRRLVAAGVDFVIIGGIAVVLHGYPRTTRDLDITFAYDGPNLDALGGVLVDLGASLRGVADQEVPFVADKRTLQGIDLLTLETDAGWLDIHRLPAGVTSKDSLRRRAERMDLEGFAVLVASPNDLITMKQAAGRPVDRTDIAALEAIKRLRAQA
jgi:hypothetical protein